MMALHKCLANGLSVNLSIWKQDNPTFLGLPSYVLMTKADKSHERNRHR